MIFNETKDLLRKTEEVLLDIGKSKKRLLNDIDKNVFHSTIGFIYTDGNFRLIKKTVFIAIIFFLLWTIFTNWTLAQLIANAINALVLAMIFAPLSMPSAILGNDVNSKDVEQVQKEIIKKKLSLLQIQAIKNNLSMLETAFESKIHISKWIITAIWGIFLYFFTQYYIPLVIAGKPIKIQTLLLVGLSLILIGILHLSTRGFSKTGKRVFMTLAFALNESTLIEKKPS